MEEWKDIPGYEGLYQASTLGKIKSLNYGREKILKSGKNKKNYLVVVLSKQGIRKSHTVHSLIAMTFLEHIPNRMEILVRHKNDIVNDNRLENLMLGSARDNSYDYHLKNIRDLPIGVCKRRNNYIAQIKIKGKQTYLGYFKTPEEASEAYQKALAELNPVN